MKVLVASADTALSDLIRVNLERRGFLVRQADWAACCEPSPPALPRAVNAVVADLNCAAPACWGAAPRLRTAFPEPPLLLLAHDWPSATQARACQPCRYLRTPVAIGDLLRCLFDLLGESP